MSDEVFQSTPRLSQVADRMAATAGLPAYAAENSPRRKTIAVDFDGVLHRYSRGWGDGTCYDEAVPGAFEFLQKVLETHNVFILSTRDPALIYEWAIAKMPAGAAMAFTIIGPEQAGPFYNPVAPNVIGITQRKLAAEVYIDDRAVRFRGSFSDVFTDMRDKPWTSADDRDLADLAAGVQPTPAELAGDWQPTPDGTICPQCRTAIVRESCLCGIRGPNGPGPGPTGEPGPGAIEGAMTLIEENDLLKRQITSLGAVLMNKFGGPDRDESACEIAARILGTHAPLLKAIDGQKLKTSSWRDVESEIRRSRPPGCRWLPLMLLQAEFAWMARERKSARDENGALLIATAAVRVGEMIAELR